MINIPSKVKESPVDEEVRDIISAVEIVREFFNHAADLSFTKKRRYTAPGVSKVVGSSLYHWRDSFFVKYLRLMSEEDLLKKLKQSDIDIAIEANPFLLETVSSLLGGLKEKASDQGVEYGKEMLLNKVYQTDVYSILKALPFKSQIFKPPRENRSVDILIVKDLDACKKIWEKIPSKDFYTYFWKHSPHFIGKCALNSVFRTYEAIALPESKKVFKRDLETNLLELAFADAPVGDPVFGQIGPAQDIDVGQPQLAVNAQ